MEDGRLSSSGKGEARIAAQARFQEPASAMLAVVRGVIEAYQDSDEGAVGENKAAFSISASRSDLS